MQISFFLYNYLKFKQNNTNFKKLIKKRISKLIFIIIISTLVIYNSFAEETCESGCKIKSWTPEIILKYIENNNKIINNLSNNLSNNVSKKTKHINIPTNINNNWMKVNINNSFSSWIWLRIYNTLFNWSEIESGFKYFLSNIDWDVPAPISRDLRLIENQNKKLNYFLSKVIKSWHSLNKIDSKKACVWVEDEWNCNQYIWNNIEIAIKNLIANNNTINLIIRKELGFMWFKSIVWSSSYDTLFAVSQDFKQELKNNYNKDTYKFCATCKWSSIDKIVKIKNKILLNDSNSKNWIEQWINAWNLLLWINDDNNKKNNLIERNLLNEELARQWVSSKNWDAVLNDLEKFQWNDFWFSIWNNPITNSFNNFIEQIEQPFKSKDFNNFTNTIWDINISNPDIENFTYKDIINSSDKLSDDNIISKNVKFLVKQNMWIISRQNKNTDKLQWRILELHINLWQSINTLEKLIPKSEKICNQQDTWNWKCNYR